MRIGLAAVALMCLVALYFWDESGRRSAGVESDAVSEAEDGKVSEPDVGVTLMSVAEESLRLNSTDIDPEDDLAILELLLTHYRRAFGENPVGLNHEITRSLVGGNSKRAAFLSPEHPSINDDGELLDRWGRPYFFHQISGTEMEVVSAGPDGELRTADDVKSESDAGQ